MKKLLFFDIDGTLLRRDTKEINQTVIDTIKMLKEDKDVLYGICTGRAKPEGKYYTEQIDADFAIYSSGQEIFYNGQKLYERVFASKTIEKITNVCNDHTDYWLFATPSGVHALNRGKSSIVDHIEAYGQMEINQTDKMPDEEVLKVWIHAKEKTEIDQIIANLDDDVTIYRWDDLMCEIIPKGENKGKAIEIFKQQFPQEELKTYGFGDGINDFEMMQVVDVAVVMDNASDELKNQADIITKSVQEDGVAHALKTLNLVGNSEDN